MNPNIRFLSMVTVSMILYATPCLAEEPQAQKSPGDETTGVSEDGSFGFAIYANLLSPFPLGLTISAEIGDLFGGWVRIRVGDAGLAINLARESNGINYGLGGAAGIRWYPSRNLSGFWLGLLLEYVHIDGDWHNVVSGWGEESDAGYSYKMPWLAPMLDIGYRWVPGRHFLIGLGASLGYGFTVGWEREFYDETQPNEQKKMSIPVGEILLEMGAMF